MKAVLLGLLISWVIGAIVTSFFLKISRWWVDKKAKQDNQEAPELIKNKL